MRTDLIKFLNLQRKIFGICPKCNDFFRLSDCKIFLKKKPVSDWMDELLVKSEKLDRLEEKLYEEEEVFREKARKKGRQLAKLAVKKIDPVFAPRGLNPDDAKAIFHPIDYIVFNGMKKGKSMKNIVLLDRHAKQREHRQIQRSIKRTVERGNYEWQTLRVKRDGAIIIE